LIRTDEYFFKPIHLLLFWKEWGQEEHNQKVLQEDSLEISIEKRRKRRPEVQKYCKPLQAARERN